jgi:cell pole-organizing protein PopZ
MRRGRADQVQPPRNPDEKTDPGRRDPGFDVADVLVSIREAVQAAPSFRNTAGSFAEHAGGDEDILELRRPLDEECAGEEPGASVRPEDWASVPEEGRGSVAEALEALREARHKPSDMSGSPRNREREPDPLETAVQGLLRPMLKAWLDAHLPRLVRQVVEEEIRRLGQEP